MKAWNHSQVVTDEIEPLINKVLAICTEHRIPALISLAIIRHEDGSGVGHTSALSWVEQPMTRQMIQATSAILGTQHLEIPGE